MLTSRTQPDPPKVPGSRFQVWRIDHPFDCVNLSRCGLKAQRIVGSGKEDSCQAQQRPSLVTQWNRNLSPFKSRLQAPYKQASGPQRSTHHHHQRHQYSSQKASAGLGELLLLVRGLKPGRRQWNDGFQRRGRPRAAQRLHHPAEHPGVVPGSLPELCSQVPAGRYMYANVGSLSQT